MVRPGNDRAATTIRSLIRSVIDGLTLGYTPKGIKAKGIKAKGIKAKGIKAFCKPKGIKGPKVLKVVPK